MMARPRKNIAASRASLLPESAPLPEIPVQEQPYPLPEGWKWVRLGDCNHYAGETINPALFQEDIFELYSVPSCITGYPEILSGKEIGSSKQSVELGDVLLCKINPRINRVWRVVGYTANRLAASSEWIVFRNKDISSKYMMLCMQSAYFREYMLSNVSGVGGSLMRAQPKHVRRYPIPLPPREEQERIVGHIESLFARLDEARQKAEAVRDSVALRRAAILHKAFTGELTAKWREEHNIRLSDWEEKSIASLCHSLKYGTAKKSQKNGAVVVLRMGNLQSGEIDWSDLAYSDDEDDIQNYRLEKGDVLFNRTNSALLVGKTSIYRGEHPAIYAGYLIKMDYKKDILTGNYLNYIMNSQRAKEYCQKVKTDGVNQSNINAKKLGAFTIPLPPLSEQQEIVRILDDLLGREQRLREAADAVVANIERMKKAILARAFRGELGRADCPSRP